MKRASVLLFSTIVLGVLLPTAFAQGGRRGAAPTTAKSSAPMDLTGYWVSIVTQNWRLRMVVPPKGDYMGIPLSAEAKKIADAWRSAKEDAAGNACKGSRRFDHGESRTPAHHLAGRQHIADGNRRRYADAILPLWQIHAHRRDAYLASDSIASWESRERDVRRDPKARYLKVSTNHLLPGFLARMRSL